MIKKIKQIWRKINIIIDIDSNGYGMLVVIPIAKTKFFFVSLVISETIVIFKTSVFMFSISVVDILLSRSYRGGVVGSIVYILKYLFNLKRSIYILVCFYYYKLEVAI